MQLSLDKLHKYWDIPGVSHGSLSLNDMHYLISSLKITPH